MLKNELVKLITNKTLIIVLVVFILLQSGLLFWQEYKNSESNYFDNTSYNALIEDVSSYTHEQALEYVSAKLEYVKLIQRVISASYGTDDLSGLFEGIDTDAIIEEYENGEYLIYTDNIHSEIKVLETVYEEIKAVVSYEDSVKAVLKNTDRYINGKKVDKDSFEYIRAVKTRDKYIRLERITPSFYPAKGMDMYCDSASGDYLILAFMIFATVLIITLEREQGLSLISKTTLKGGAVHGLVKASALGILCVIVSLIMHICSFVVIAQFYPVKDLTVPIQSVAGYTYCALEISAWQYILLQIVMKIVFYLCCLGFFYFICCIFRRCIPVYFTSVGFIGVLVALHKFIKPNSYLAFINTYNPVTYSRVKDILSRFQCIDIFGTAVERTVFAVVYQLILVLICVAIGTVLYAVSEEREKKGADFKWMIKRNKLHVGMFRHEMFKVFISQYVILLLMGATLVSYMFFTPAQSFNNSVADMFYDYHSERVEGKYTTDVMEYIDNVILLNDEKREELGDSADAFTKLELDSTDTALKNMKKYAEYLSEKKNSYFLNNDGFIMLTGGDGQTNTHNVIITILLCIFGSICFISVMSVDYQNGEDRLIKSTINGGIKYRFSKLAVGLIIAVILYVVFWIPNLVSVINEFGTMYIDVPVYSLVHLANLPAWVSIKEYIIAVYIFRFIIILAIMGISYLVSVKARSKAVSVILVWMITILPLVLYLTL